MGDALNPDASAPPDYTLFGTFDAGIRVAPNQAAPGASSHDPASGTKAGVVGSGMDLDLIGVRGSEDLGGGDKALFQLENTFSPGTGSASPPGALFNQVSHVGISDGRNTLYFGREYNEGYQSLIKVDAFGVKDPTNNPGSAVVSLNPAARYVADYGPFQGSAQISPGGVAGSQAGSSMGAQGSYQFGPTIASASAERFYDAADDRTDQFSFGAKHALDPSSSLSAIYARQSVSGGADSGQLRQIAGAGGMAKRGASTYWLAYYVTRLDNASGVHGASGSQGKLMGMAAYGFSKLTSVYASFDLAENSGAMVPPSTGKRSALGATFGIKRSF